MSRYIFHYYGHNGDYMRRFIALRFSPTENRKARKEDLQYAIRNILQGTVKSSISKRQVLHKFIERLSHVPEMAMLLPTVN